MTAIITAKATSPLFEAEYSIEVEGGQRKNDYKKLAKTCLLQHSSLPEAAKKEV